MGEEKKTECIKVWCSESMFTDIAKLATADDRSVSEYVSRVLRHHLYGHIACGDGHESSPE